MGEAFFDGYFSFFPSFWVEALVWFGFDSDGVVFEVDVVPCEVDDFLVAESGEEECLVERVFPGVACFEEFA